MRLLYYYLRVAASYNFSIGILASEANHEAAESLVTVKGAIVCAHVLSGHVVRRSSGVSRRRN